jgi:hypothetical protein
MKAALRAVSLLGALAVLAGCGGGGASGSSAPPKLAETKPGTAKITTFDVPDAVPCPSGPSTTFPISWSVAGSASQRIIVDGRTIAGTDAATGTVNADVHCDPTPHDVVLYALDKAGNPTTSKKIMTTTRDGGYS